MEEIPEEFDEGTPDSVPEKEPDAALKLTDRGITMPEFLKGHVGTFTVRTPNTTGEFETTDGGLPESEYYDGIFAIMPSEGSYHSDLREGLMAVSTPELPETVFEVIDERTDE